MNVAPKMLLSLELNPNGFVIELSIAPNEVYKPYRKLNVPQRNR